MHASKINYVLSQPQTKVHRCRWPGCEIKVPASLWGCWRHWAKLSPEIRTKIYRTYTPGQESGAGSPAYIKAEQEAQEWIKCHQ